jgi:V/A-type H+/Na+-transporting ATPase subunit I
MKNVTLVGPARDRASVLEALQMVGVMHVVPSRPESSSSPLPPAYPAAYSKDATDALRYLLDSPLKRNPLTDRRGLDLETVVREALALRSRQRDVEDRIDELKERIEEVEPWGDFHLPPPDELDRRRLWFYVVPLYRFRQWDGGSLVFQLVHRDHRNAYVVVVSRDEPPAGSVPAPRSHVGARPLSELRVELERAIGEMEDVRAERWALTRHIGLMVVSLAEAEDREALRRAASGVLDAGELFAVRGWVPERDVATVARLAREKRCALAIEDPRPGDSPPVLLENAPGVEAGQDLVAFYQLPGYEDWDPSPVVYYSFSIFFAMILGDAGYAAIILIATLLFWKKLSPTPTARRSRRLLLTIGILSVAYGVVLGSYFGASPPPGSILARVKLLEINDYSAMMRLAVGIGVVHLILANLVAAWNQRRSSTALSRLGWAVAIAGGFAGFLGHREVAVPCAVVGATAVLLFTSARPLASPLDLVKRLVDGLLGLTNVSKAFGDVLSYLRLFALGLASASLAVTFNQLAADVIGANFGAALLLGLLILVVGHGVNFLLGIIGGVIHGLRLNLIEMYSWSIFGEGKKFEALRKRETLRWKT